MNIIMNIIIDILAVIGLCTVVAVVGTIVTVAQYDPTRDPENQYYRRPEK